MGNDENIWKTVWDGNAFAELAARLKDAEKRLDKLEAGAPRGVEARAQRQPYDLRNPKDLARMAKDIRRFDGAQRQREIEAEAKLALRRMTEDLAQKSAFPPNIVIEPKGDAELRDRIAEIGFSVEARERRIAELERQNTHLQAANGLLLQKINRITGALQGEIDNAREN